jgi:subtilase family serine protease
VGPISPSTKLYVNVSLKLPNPAALKQFNDGVSNPKSKTYRHFITATQFGQQFGQPVGIVNAVVNYLRSEGLTITLVGKNHLNIMASGTARQVQTAFNTTIQNYHAVSSNEPGRLNYYAFTNIPRVPTTFASRVLNVAGLENFTKPHPRTTLSPDQVHTLYNTLPMYTSGEQGQGRTVGVTNFDGFQLSNLPLFYSQFGLPTPAGGVGSNVTVVSIDGGAQNNPPGGEGDLDIQMVLGQAPLCNFVDYDCAGPLIDVLTREADDNIADIITESYGEDLSLSDAVAANAVRQQMTAQGQTYMFAAGDNGTSLEPFAYPNYEPEVLSIGGSAAKTDANGNRQTETAWNNGGGGWTTENVPFNVLPAWQVATGCPTNINFRLNPDVALQAAGDQFGGTAAFFFYYQGSLDAGELGTSFASPAWAGGLAVTEQWLIDNGGWSGNSTGAGINRFGRIADLLYSQNMDPTIWYDILVGDTGPLPDGSEAIAHAGWDFTTGLGPIDYAAFANSQVVGGGGGGGGTLGSGTASVFSDAANGVLGQNQSGSNTNLTGSNGLSFNVQSVASVYGPAVGVQLVWSLPGGTVTSLTAKIGASAAQGTTLFVYALDAQGNYDLVSTQPLGATSSTITVKNLKNYAIGGQLTLVTRAIIPSRFNVSQFTLDISQATLSGSIH